MSATLTRAQHGTSTHKRCSEAAFLLLLLGVFLAPFAVVSFCPTQETPRWRQKNSRTCRQSAGSSSLRMASRTASSLGSSAQMPLPFFASPTEKAKEGRASITTRIPIGKLFDSRDYIFSTMSNIRGYEWTVKETEELLDDLVDASRGIVHSLFEGGSAATAKSSSAAPALHAQDYELGQIVLIPLPWDTDTLGLGCRYDVHDGQQRLVTLCLIFAALRERFNTLKGMEETATELRHMLNPPKTRKAQVLRIELNKRDDALLSRILQGDMKQVSNLLSTKDTMNKANQQISKNFGCITSRVESFDKDELLTLLDFMIENVYLLVCVPESASIARNIVMGQGKGKDNEVIDDFKGLVCFRYISVPQDTEQGSHSEKAMFKTFDAWDRLSSSIVDVDMGIVGRETVSDACLLRASASLRTKIATPRKQLFWLEQWMRNDLTKEKYQGDGFFNAKVQPASLVLGQFRNGSMPPFGFSKRGKIARMWPSIENRLEFLRELTMGVPSTKEVEMVLLELLLRAMGSSGASVDKRMPLAELEPCLRGAEQLALYFALVKPTATRKYKKLFFFLDAMDEKGENVLDDLLTTEERLEIRDALYFNNLGANASGKRLATAVLKRLNYNEVLVATQQANGTQEQRRGPQLAILEPILPAQATKKVWGDVWPEPSERNEWVHRFGNLCLVSNKVPQSLMKKSFEEKKARCKHEPWPLTSRLFEETDVWDKNAVKENAAKVIGLVEYTWGL